MHPGYNRIIWSLLAALYQQLFAQLWVSSKDRKRSASLFVVWKYYITGEQIHTVQMFAVRAIRLNYSGLEQYFTRSNQWESLQLAVTKTLLSGCRNNFSNIQDFFLKWLHIHANNKTVTKENMRQIQITVSLTSCPKMSPILDITVRKIKNIYVQAKREPQRQHELERSFS